MAPLSRLNQKGAALKLAGNSEKGFGVCIRTLGVKNTRNILGSVSPTVPMSDSDGVIRRLYSSAVPQYDQTNLRC